MKENHTAFSYVGDQDNLRHPVGLHPHMDTLQRHGVDLHLLPVLRTGHSVGHRLLAVLRKLHNQSGLLRSVQRHIQEDFQEPAAVSV